MVPLMFRCVEKLELPAELRAMQEYSPICSACAESMLKVLIFLFIFITVMPC